VDARFVPSLTECYTSCIHEPGERDLKRADGRNWDALRTVKITPGFLSFAEGSALIEVGKTRVICSVSVEERVPAFLREGGGGGGGWVTAEYAMLPRSTVSRTQRDSQGRVNGRSQEIQRLIGRSLRAIVDMKALGERSLIADCDVLQADGGTRTAAITGAYVALYQALHKLANMGVISSILPIKTAVAATSVGIVHGYRMLDLCYDEDSAAEVDFNVVMTGKGDFVEIQGTAEGKPFNKESVDALLALADKGIKELLQAQEAAIATIR
jgi:ribonuclease PH